MFIFIDKKNQKGYLSKTFVAISRRTGIKYNKMVYYADKMKKGYYEDMDVIFCKGEQLKSKQGGRSNLLSGLIR